MRELAATTCHAVAFNRAIGPNDEAPVVGRIPRVARLLAFAHHLDAQIRSGAYDDMADAARRLGLSRGRITQVLNLTLLAPTIQAAILALPPVKVGRDLITERTLRPVVGEAAWERQVTVWQRVNGRTAA